MSDPTPDSDDPHPGDPEGSDGDNPDDPDRCDDCTLCHGADRPGLPPAPFATRGPRDHRFEVLCRSCVHALGVHALAVPRLRMPGLQFTLKPSPGSRLDRLQQLVRAKDDGLLTPEELRGAVRRPMDR